jgi:hypothetical protein
LEATEGFKQVSTKMSTITPGQKAGSESRKPRGSFRTFRRAWRVRENEQLTAEESATTLFRFFRSEHVVDLRLIAKLAVSLFIFHLVLVVVFSGVNPLIHSFFHFFRAQFTSAHVGNTVLRFFDALTSGTLQDLIIYFSPAIPIYGGIVAWAYMSAATRLGVVDLFACEISTLCRVGTVFDVGKKYVEMYHGKGSAADKHAAVEYLAAKHTMAEQSSQSYASNENYFPIFDNNSSDLQSLQALVVGYITEYYTYMKAMRDLQRKLASIDPAQMSRLSESAPNGSFHSDEWHETLANIIYVLFLGYESARKSVNDLIEFQPSRAENTIVILLTELPCYAFLCDHHKNDEVKFMRLQLREADYREIVPALIASVNAVHQGNEKYWAPAERTIPELETRYNTAMETLRQCAKR